jgi:L-ribulose-5-phosphate 4-epimerase
MSHSALQHQVHWANLELVRHGLVLHTWGNASAIDRQSGVVAIKPSGVEYSQMQPEDMVLVALETGKSLGSSFKPSSDTTTHLALYRAFPDIVAVVHTHSKHATAWAQAGRDLPCYGTTHADYFYGAVPCVPMLELDKLMAGYEQHTGAAIAHLFAQKALDPQLVPAVLLHGHASFCWGSSAEQAVHHAVVLETVAQMALETLQINPDAQPISQALLDKHHFRKHGKNAYYGQG